MIVLRSECVGDTSYMIDKDEVFRYPSNCITIFEIDGILHFIPDMDFMDSYIR